MSQALIEGVRYEDRHVAPPAGSLTASAEADAELSDSVTHFNYPKRRKRLKTQRISQENQHQVGLSDERQDIFSEIGGDPVVIFDDRNAWAVQTAGERKL